ncbi:HlyD family secretion protein [Candidatus Liberibacter brunswickensis]|uniref:HlyD family secretion protein n=1 Tax=Candidatus Liberibacter brunswickensis TaxID=1968796 RepID=UPI002FE305FA
MNNFIWKSSKKINFTSLEKITILSTIGSIALLTWSFIFPIEINVSSSGEILNDDDVVEIKSPFSGIIKKFQVKDGEHIMQGKPLLTFEDTEITNLINLKKVFIDDLQCRVDTSRDALNFLHKKYNTLEKSFETRDEQLLYFLRDYPSTCYKSFNYETSNVFKSLKLKLTRIKNIYLNYLDLKNKGSLLSSILLSHQKDLTIMQELFKHNSVSKNDLNQQERILYKSLIESTENSNAQENALRHINELNDEANLEFATYIKDISRDLEQNQHTLTDEISKLDVLRKKIEQQTILSPITGTIVYNKSFSYSNYAQQSQLLMKIVPQSKLTFVRAKVTPKQIQNIKKDHIAVVRFPYYTNIQEKRFKAIIEKISPIISHNNSDLQTQNYYEVILKINDPAYFNSNIELRNGFPAEIIFTAERTTIAQEIIRPIMKNWPKIFER